VLRFGCCCLLPPAPLLLFNDQAESVSLTHILPMTSAEVLQTESGRRDLPSLPCARKADLDQTGLFGAVAGC
jgi:hypothetical protein